MPRLRYRSIPPGVAILALVTLATWFGWQLDID